MVTTLENEFLRISIRNSGAELVSIKGVKDQKEYLWQGDPEYWPRRAPVLFPIVGKLRNNCYHLDGQTYTLPQHGLARNRMFDLESSSLDSAVYMLPASNETRKVYPFDFELMIKYELKEKTLFVIYTVLNKGTQALPFSIGGHPGFNVQLYDGEQFSDYYLEFKDPETENRYLLDDGLFSGDTEPILEQQRFLELSHKLFEKDAIVLKDIESEEVQLKSKNSPYHLRFSFPGFPYFGIWSTVKPAPFVCLEPWFGLADRSDSEGDLFQKEGVQIINPGKQFTCSYYFEVVSVL